MELYGNMCDGVIYFFNICINILWGQVYDEKVWYLMGGVLGYVGLFFDIYDMVVLM